MKGLLIVDRRQSKAFLIFFATAHGPGKSENEVQGSDTKRREYD